MKRFKAVYGRWPRNLRGALWMLASAVTFTVMTTLIKYLGEDYPAALQTFYRQLAGFVVLLPLMLRDPIGAFKTSRPGILVFRSAAGTLGTILAFYAYQKMPLAEANALSFTRALWLVPFAAFVLREKVGPRRISATVIGFLGVLLMLQPGEGEHPHLSLAAGAALAASLLFALTITGMKVMTRDHSTTTLMIWSAALGLIMAALPAVWVWRWPATGDLVLLSVMGVMGMVTQACYIKGMSEGDAVAMAPIDYTRLVFAIIFGYVLFGDIPNYVTMAGATIVIASTLYITFREMKIGVERPQTKES